MPPDEVAPNAAQPTPAPKGGSESFMAALGRHGFVDSDAELDAEDAGGEEATPALAPKTNGAPSADPNAAELAQLQALAKKLGYNIDGTKLEVDERYKFREATRKTKAKLDAEAKARADEFAKERGDWESTKAKDAEVVQWAKTLEGAFKNAKDYDERAKAMGFESWDAMIEDSVSQFSDPNYQELKESRKFREELKAKEERAAKEAAEKAEKETKSATEKAAAEARTAAMRRQIGAIQQHMRDSGDEALAALSEDGILVKAVLDLQMQNYDRETRSTITVQQALDMPLQNGKTLKQNAREHHANVAKRAVLAFGADVIPEDIRAKLGLSKEAPKQLAPRTQTTPTNGKTPASQPKKFDPRSPEWMRKARRELEAASAIDDAERESRGRRR